MKALQGIDWLSHDSIDNLLQILLTQIDFIGQESLKPEGIDYAQLKANIAYTKHGFERIERLLLDAKNSPSPCLRLDTKGKVKLKRLRRKKKANGRR